MKVFVVIPTIRSLRFLNEWQDEFKNCFLMVVEDHQEKTVKVPKIKNKRAFHYCWEDIRDDFGRDEWIFSRKNAGIRSYGFWKAYDLGADFVITLDDDCYPVDKNFVKAHINNLASKGPDGWFATFPHPEFMYTRGVPYKIRDKNRAVISHGLWSNKIDLDGITEVNNPNLNIGPYPPIKQFVPAGYNFPMCSMNLAFKKEIISAMFFPMMGFDPEGKKWGYDRFDDIWAGVFAKKICDHLDLAVVNGSPFVEHRKASDPAINAVKEKEGLKINEFLWETVNMVKLTKNTPRDCYKELARKIKFPDEEYFKKLKTAMQIWANLY